jgi:hypothetical protein
MRHLVPVAGIVLVWSAAVAAQLSGAAAIARTERILQHLQSGDAAALVKLFDEKMRAALPEDKLKGVWSGVVGQFGAFKNIAERREGRVRDRQAVELILAFEKDTIVMRAVFDPEGMVGGLVFRPLSGAQLPPSKR